MQNVDYFEMSVGGSWGVGCLDLDIFPKFKMLKYGINLDDVWVIYWLDIGKIWYIHGWYMIEIVTM